MYRLRILHISDLHERADRENEAFRRKRVLGDAWITNLKLLVEEGGADLVCFSGDAADWGLVEEYERATGFFQDVLNVLGLGWDHFFAVPGNHDVYRKIHEDVWRRVRDKVLRSDDLDVSRWLYGRGDLLDGKDLERLGERFSAYRAWLHDVGRGALAVFPGYRETLRLPDRPFDVHIVGLDSAWLCGDDNDTGKLRLTDGQVGRLTADSDGNALEGFRLVLVHHPLAELADGAAARRLLAERTDLVLRGHLHAPELLHQSDPDGRGLHELAAGCLYEGDRADHHANGCTLVDLQLDEDGRPWSCDVWLRSWSPAGHWHDDDSRYAGFRGGRLTLSFGGPAVTTQEPPTATEPTYPDDAVRRLPEHREDAYGRLEQAEIAGNISPEVLSHVHFPKALVDQKIEQELSTLRKVRFFAAFDRIQFPIVFATRLMEGELSGGTADIRCRALAWCARILSHSEKSSRAEEFLEFSRTIGSCLEIEIASAFLDSANGEKKAALSALADIESPISRSAALIVVRHHGGSQAAVDWLQDTDLTDGDLDSDGKLVLLTLLHELGQWEAAQRCIEALTDDDFNATPTLHHMAAMTDLTSTVPKEFRPSVLSRLPFEAAFFPLASDAPAIEARRVACKHFIRSAETARELDCPIAGQIDVEYALWLELRDPDETVAAEGRKNLQNRLRDTQSALRLVPLGLQFGVRLDLDPKQALIGA